MIYRDRNGLKLKGTMRTLNVHHTVHCHFLFASSEEKYWSIFTDSPARSPEKDPRILGGGIAIPVNAGIEFVLLSDSETYKNVSHRLGGKSVDFWAIRSSPVFVPEVNVCAYQG